MNMHALTNLVDAWSLRLMMASAQGAVLATGVWLLCRWLPSLSATTRSRLWWLVAAQMLLGLLWPDSLRLHPLPAPATPAPVAQTLSLDLLHGAATRPVSHTTAPAASDPPVRRARREAGNPSRPSLPWTLLAVLVWGLGTLVGILLLILEHRRLARRLQRSHPAGTALQQMLATEARVVGLRQPPALRISPDVDSPQVSGLLRPTVLMPLKGLADWSRADLVLALRHECLHLRHHDLWWGWVPAVALRLFFFNPAAALAAREFALAREAAVDQALLRQPDVSARRYGELLLRLGVAPSSTIAMATASPSFRILHRRLTMMNALSTRGRAANAAGTLALLLVAGASLPLSATPTAREAVPAIPAVPTFAAAATPALPPVSATPAGPAVPAAPATPASHVHSHSGKHYSTFVYSDDKTGTSLDIDRDDDGAETNLIVSGSGKDAQIIKITKDPTTNASHLWYHNGDKSYVVDDAALMAKVSAVMESTMSKFSEEQSKLGEQQGKLGEQQGLLSGKQAEIGATQARLGAEQARLAAQMSASALHAGGDKALDDLERQQDDLGKQEDELGKQQDELGKLQDELGKQQDELGKRQDEIGKQQDEAARAAGQQIREIMKQAIDSGLARPQKG